MNFLASLPPKKRFYAALVCLPLMFFIIAGTAMGLEAAQPLHWVVTLVVGTIGVVAAWKMQQIAAWIIALFEKA